MKVCMACEKAQGCTKTKCQGTELNAPVPCHESVWKKKGEVREAGRKKEIERTENAASHAITISRSQEGEQN